MKKVNEYILALIKMFGVGGAVIAAIINILGFIQMIAIIAFLLNE